MKLVARRSIPSVRLVPGIISRSSSPPSSSRTALLRWSGIFVPLVHFGAKIPDNREAAISMTGKW